jgi:ParB family chromosome partitioning protein
MTATPRPARQRRSASDLTFAAPTGVHRTDPGEYPKPSELESVAEEGGRADNVPVAQVAANPLNSRDVDARPDKVTQLGHSIAEHGQLQPSAVVTRAAFLAIFPEFEERIGHARWVQITGARRRAAILERGLSTIDIVVKDDRAQSRTAFLAATTAENLDREDLDPIEEARAVQHLLDEFGTVRAVATHMSRSPGWVTQRTNLLKLAPEVQAALRVDDDNETDVRRLPLRDVRTWHEFDPARQLEALEQWRKKQGPAAAAGESATDKPTATTPVRLSRTAAAIRRLGGTPVEIAASLRAEMASDDLRALAEELLRAE